MLDQNTKKIIDAARDVLVGKLPAPNTQVEQITLEIGRASCRERV